MADKRPEYRWVFDPHQNEVHLDAMLSGHPAERKTFGTMAIDVDHPERREGYAFPIDGGWRVMDNQGAEVDDRFVVKRVLAALNHENYVPLPHVLPHGDPLKHHAQSQDQDFLYRGISPQYRAAVEQHGLQPAEDGYIFMTDDPEYAATYGGDLWRIDVRGLDAWESDPEYHNWIVQDQPIGPERLTLVREASH